MKDFRDLVVWNKAHQLVLATYKVTSSFPKDELYTLTSQMRRSSSSIATNIAEGCGRRGNGEFHRFLQNATGSASELEYQFLLARDLSYFSEEQYALLQESVVEIKKMLASLINRVEAERLRH
jgi:four helix bundle protein